MIYPSIESLMYYAETHLFLDELDAIYVRNMLLDEMKLTDYTQYEIDAEAIEALTCPDTVLEPLVNYAVDNGIITDDQREYFSCKLMNIVSRRPSEVTDLFMDLHTTNPSKAFDWLYDYSIKNNYIKLTQIAKNKHWDAKGTKGKLEVTINLSKPEKSNKDTAKLLDNKASSYPACAICKENEGFAGHGMFRQNLRTIPLTLGGEQWIWQFSPFSYFNQHGIAINCEHVPMKVDEATVNKLLDFVDFMPNYFIGCNAALPIVGGSILTHDHFQGGLKQLPMHKAPDLKKLKAKDYPLINVSVVDWYNSVIRLIGSDRKKMLEFATKIINAWSEYTNENINIVAKTDKQHNAVTPIVRKVQDGKYCIELILRNNMTSEKYPDGIYHAHPEFHNIKSEAIGLIEAMGLFILPGRLDKQLKEIESFLIKEVKYSADKLSSDMQIHKTMIEKLIKEGGSGKMTVLEAQLNVKDEINRVCECILENTAVFKKDEVGQAAFAAFLESVNIK